MTVDKHLIYSAWAPAESVWSRWVKASVFACIPRDLEITESHPSTVDLSAFGSSADREAVVIDLPGHIAVGIGIALAAKGFRPVPLFCSCPPDPEDAVRMTAAAVPTRAMIEALVAGAPILLTTGISADAPPVFLLDSQRSGNSTYISNLMYDNRSAVFASDFPTATFLRGNGILRARLVRDTTYAIGDDLRYALRHWIEGGITINSFSAQGTPLDVDWPKGGLLGELIERFRLMLTLRRNRHGGYGRLVRDSGGG